jgi:hypothetical protein
MAGSGYVKINYVSGSRRPKNKLRIQIRNTVSDKCGNKAENSAVANQ